MCQTSSTVVWREATTDWNSWPAVKETSSEYGDTSITAQRLVFLMVKWKKIVDSISLMFIGMSYFCCTDLGGECIPFVHLLQLSTRISGFNPLTPRSNF